MRSSSPHSNSWQHLMMRRRQRTVSFVLICGFSAAFDIMLSTFRCSSKLSLPARSSKRTAGSPSCRRASFPLTVDVIIASAPVASTAASWLPEVATAISFGTQQDCTCREAEISNKHHAICHVLSGALCSMLFSISTDCEVHGGWHASGCRCTAKSLARSTEHNLTSSFIAASCTCGCKFVRREEMKEIAWSSAKILSRTG